MKTRSFKREKIRLKLKHKKKWLVFALFLVCVIESTLFFLSELTTFYVVALGVIILFSFDVISSNTSLLILVFMGFIHAIYFFIAETFYRYCPHYLVENLLFNSSAPTSCNIILGINPCFYSALISITLIVVSTVMILTKKR